jgi:hypothetical protein
VRQSPPARRLIHIGFVHQHRDHRFRCIHRLTASSLDRVSFINLSRSSISFCEPRARAMLVSQARQDSRARRVLRLLAYRFGVLSEAELDRTNASASSSLRNSGLGVPRSLIVALFGLMAPPDQGPAAHH